MRYSALSGSKARQRNASSVRCSRSRQHPNQKTAFSCGNKPVRKAFFIFRTWQTHCRSVDYVIVIQSSCEHQCVQLTAMLLAAEPGVDPCCVDIAVPQNIRQMLQIMMCPIKAHSEQMPKVVGKDLFRSDPGCGAQLLHPSPDGVSADGLSMPAHKNRA